MIVYLNGRLIPAEQAVVSVFDRGFLYGDGLFETLRVHRGRLFRWRDHATRFEQGAERLGIACPFSATALLEQARAVVQANELQTGWLRLQLTRGQGRRGYSPRGAREPTLLITAHPADEGKASVSTASATSELKLITSIWRVPAGDPLSAVKTLNKLPQVLARAEADRQEADDALLLNSEGCLAEATGSNLFWVADDALHTPALECGVLPGITRRIVIELCRKLGVPCRETNAQPDVLEQCDGAFLTSVGHGIRPIASLDGLALPSCDLIERLQRAYHRLLDQECAG